MWPAPYDSGPVREVRLVVPPGALDRDVAFSLAPIAIEDPAAPVVVAFDLRPDGTTLSRPARLEFEYDPVAMDAFGAADQAFLEVVTREAGQSGWRSLPRVSSSTGTLAVVLHHLSPYGLVVPKIYPKKGCAQ